MKFWVSLFPLLCRQNVTDNTSYITKFSPSIYVKDRYQGYYTKKQIRVIPATQAKRQDEAGIC